MAPNLIPTTSCFIIPVRNLIEGRNEGILDTTLCSAIGRLDVEDLKRTLGGYGGNTCIFAR